MTNRILQTTVAGALLILLAAIPVQAQSADSNLTFEVASVKPADPNAQGTSIRVVPGGGLNMTNITLRNMITFSYDIRDFQLSGGPGWMGSERFDIQAKPPATDTPIVMANMTEEQRRAFQTELRMRLRALLAERFQLVVRKETKELPAYALVVGKNGHKLEPVPEAAQPGQQRMGMSMGRGQITATGADLQMLCNVLANSAGRPVVDKTGLKGRFNFKMEWTPDPGAGHMAPPGGPRPDAPPPADLTGPSLFTAVQEQLGLKLDSVRAPVDAYVVEKAEKPSEN